MNSHRNLRYTVLAACSLFFLLGCNDSPTVKEGTGRLDIQLTDAPIDMTNVQRVEVTVTGVLVYPGVEGMESESSPPIVLTTHPGTFDLLTLTGGASTLLASGEVPAGFYQRIRLEISSATLTYQDGTTVDLKIESNKVDVPIPFQVSTGDGATVLLDFDAAASVQVNETATDTFILRPVVTPKTL